MPPPGVFRFHRPFQLAVFAPVCYWRGPGSWFRVPYSPRRRCVAKKLSGVIEIRGVLE